MKKRLLIVSAIIIFVIAGIGFYFYLPYSESFTKSTDLSQESIAGLKVHQNFTDKSLISRYGLPIEKEDNNIYNYYVWKNGLNTASVISGKNKGDIVRLIITNEYNNSLKTKNGFDIGSNKKDVITYYGEDYYISNEQGADIIGYIDHKHHLTLEFWCDGKGKVMEIRLDDDKVV